MNLLGLLHWRTPLGEVHRARGRVVDARMRWAHTRFGQSANTLQAQAQAHPLACVGIAMAIGFAVGRYVHHPAHLGAALRLGWRQLQPLLAHLLS